jgi:hypothetical protein
MDKKSAIAGIAIYPAIGVARVGNSPSEYFIGPEIPGQFPEDEKNYRDDAGCIKRQAARFRVYALDHKGRILSELTADDAKIRWTVHVANKKSEWYNFDQALDVPASQGKEGESTAIASLKRNANITDADRKGLIIDPGPRTIQGASVNSDGGDAQYAFDTGQFMGTDVYLGELRTDEAGRLLFLGGRGHSASYNDSPLTTFANNETWHDDTSDGSVDVEVGLKDGRRFKAEGAWVLTAPPNYAPGVQAFTTGYELLEDVFTTAGTLPAVKTPEFYAHIYPTLKNLSLNQWVNAGIAREFGWGSGYDFENPGLIRQLADSSEASRPLRQIIFESFRNPDYAHMDANGWPALYGDAMTLDFSSTDPREWYAITPLQYRYLRLWAEGKFTVGKTPSHKDWEALSPEEQANGLTEAALEETLGGPFHPGCEFTWPMRHAMMYDAPFRIKRREEEKNDFGETLTFNIALAPDGPLGGSTPGDITRWMAVPWQTDTSSCLSAYKAYAGEYLPTFWPARVPNDVVTEQDYVTIMDKTASPNERVNAFSPDERLKWLRGIAYDDKNPANKNPDYKNIITKFTAGGWHKVGIVLEKSGPEDTPLFPDKIWVETGRKLDGGIEKSAPHVMWMKQAPRSLR